MRDASGVRLKTSESIAKYSIEEANEVIEAIESNENQ